MKHLGYFRSPCLQNRHCPIMLKLSQKNVPLATAPFYLPISDGKDLKKKEKKKKKAIIC